MQGDVPWSPLAEACKCETPTKHKEMKVSEGEDFLLVKNIKE